MLRTLAIVVGTLLVACGSSPPSKQPVVPASEPPRADPPPQPARPPVPTGPRAPMAEQRPHEVQSPNGTRVDPFFWLRDDTRKDPQVIAHLEAENSYAKASLDPHKQLEDT